MHINFCLTCISVPSCLLPGRKISYTSSSWHVLVIARSSQPTLPHRHATLIYALLYFPQPFTFPARGPPARESTVLPTSSDVCVRGIVETRLPQLSYKGEGDSCLTPSSAAFAALSR